MAVVGVDFGALHSKIGVARNRGIDIITNEVSNRATPSLVGFGPKLRSIGESAKTQEVSNFKNTIGSLKRLIGRTISDPEVQEVEKKFINAKLVDVGGSVGVQVMYQGEECTFSATQLAAMYFGRLRDIAAKELKTGVSDIVIAVPGWYTEVQRRAILDAAAIANLNCLRVVNDSTAVALGYGITKSDLPEPENPRHVVFVDVGHSNMTVSVVAFSKGQLQVKASAYDRHLGGRDIDYALVEHFSEEFKDKYKIDVMSNPKASFRLTAGCERLKKVLSANAEATLNVESIVVDVDATSKLTREQYEELIAHVLNRIPAVVQKALQDSQLSLDQIDSVELVGGSTRIPAVRAKIQDAFPGKVLKTTLNQDEACARGATFTCAMLSPVFRVRDFQMHDIAPYSIKVQWDKAPEDTDEDTELVVFPKGNGIPSTKVLTYYRKAAFDLEALYAEPSTLPGGINPWISRFTAKDVTPDAKGDLSCVKLKIRLSQHGIVNFEQAYVEEAETEEQPMEVDGEAQSKKKRSVKKKELPIVVGNTSLEKGVLEKMREQEAQMHAADKLVMDTEDAKNALEEYVYDMRAKLEERYTAYVQQPEKEKLLVALQEAEDWLYSEEGEDASKSAYVGRLDDAKKLGDPVAFRWRETEERPRVVSQLRETINGYMARATSGDEKYAHIDEKEKQSIVEKCATVQKWLDDQIARQAEKPKNVEPVLKSEDVLKKRDEIIYFATPILTKPKPKPATTETPKTETPESADGKTEGKEEPKEPSEMDVD